MKNLNHLFKPIDMTEGAPWKNILAFMIPMLLGNIAQQMYNAVDSIVVGRYLGDNALAAVGNAGPIVNLLIVLFVGISMGASIVVAQYLGAKNREALSGAIGNCLILTAISVLAVMTLAVLFTRPPLEVMNTPDSIMQWCESYLLIMLVVQSLTNSFGETVIAANVIVSRVDGFAQMPALSFGTAATFLVRLPLAYLMTIALYRRGKCRYLRQPV